MKSNGCQKSNKKWSFSKNGLGYFLEKKSLYRKFQEKTTQEHERYK
jgi:hypothetical protein